MEKIFFRIDRDFSEVFGDGFKFLRQNFRPFYMALIYVVGPVLIMYAVVNGLMYTQMNAVMSGLVSDIMGGLSSSAITGNADMESFGWWILILFATGMVLNVFFIGALVHFMRLYDERGVRGFVTDDVWKAVTRDFWYILVTALGLILVLLPIMLALSVVFFLFALVPVVGPVLIVLAVIALMLIFIPVISQWVYSVYVVRCTERRGVFESVSRATTLVRSKFWGVWLVGLVVLLLSMVAGVIVALPEGIIQGITGFHAITSGDVAEAPGMFIIVLNSITVVLTQLVMAIPYLFFGIQHYSLVERVDGSGMAEMIDEIGQPDDDEPSEY